ncbi:hypothetical protein PDIG_12450 [Penicillium digitatum PHI26]|uniref:Uncharacterized protein n=2 Tax=Penicillium digitatum TaxID=36651 RepID=K9G9W9_PEND2|nr:hypothetical protein PDIP_38670 [Penicillium digitatum Pd1]EKV15792.1 hypothetical protein PDIP_38670 [Penicillium digitatum Pd1]EKV17857.1 hypothetical protein PDIG_12450 [Penicillium digitatum PHI26]
MTSIIVPSLGKKEAVFLDVLCPLHNMPSCKIFGSTRRGNKNLSQRELYHTRETRPHAHATVSGCVGLFGSVGLMDMFICRRLLPAFLNSCLHLYMMLVPLRLQTIAIVLVGETYGFYPSNALTHQPISSRHGADVLGRL